MKELGIEISLEGFEYMQALKILSFTVILEGSLGNTCCLYL